jgi:hypothetical protein
MDLGLLCDTTLRAVIRELYPRLLPNGDIVAVVEGETCTVNITDALPPKLKDVDLAHWPNALLRDNESGWLYAIDVGALHGQLTECRCRTISLIIGAESPVVIVNAFASQHEFDSYAYRPWFTSLWFADVPGVMLHLTGAVDWRGRRVQQTRPLRILYDLHMERRGHHHIHVSTGASAECAYAVEI